MSAHDNTTRYESALAGLAISYCAFGQQTHRRRSPARFQNDPSSLIVHSLESKLVTSEALFLYRGMLQLLDTHPSIGLDTVEEEFAEGGLVGLALVVAAPWSNVEALRSCF